MNASSVVQRNRPGVEVVVRGCVVVVVATGVVVELELVLVAHVRRGVRGEGEDRARGERAQAGERGSE